MARRAPGPGPVALPPPPLPCLLLLLLLAAPAPARAREAWHKVTLPVNYEDAECRTPRAAGGGGGEGGDGAEGEFQPCERGGQPGQATGRCPKVITAGKCYALCNGAGCKPDESTMVSAPTAPAGRRALTAGPRRSTSASSLRAACPSTSCRSRRGTAR